MKNKMSDLNNHLFAQIERLTDEGMTSEQIEDEVNRAEAIVSVADQLNRNYDIQLKAANLFAKHGEAIFPLLPLIGGKKE